MSTYYYYTMDYNRLEKKLWEQNDFYTELELKLKATRAQSKNVSNYPKKKSYKVKRLETIIN